MSISEIASAGAVIGTRLIPVMGIGLCSVSSNIQFRTRELSLPIGRQPNESACQELYERYKKQCKGVRTHRCQDIREACKLVQCGMLRLQFTIKCESQGGGGRNPRPCSHAKVICDTFHFAQKCQERFPRDWIGQNMTEFGFQATCNWCIVLQAACRGHDWKLPCDNSIGDAR